MVSESLENFLFIPHSYSGSDGDVYELSRVNEFQNNSFVIIPYQDPQKGKLSPQFYEIKSKMPSNFAPPKQVEIKKITLTPQTSKKDYLTKVKQLKEHIQQGNIYEINYCIQFYAENISLDPLTVFLKLNSLAKAPYSYLLKLGDDFVICCSPELFLKKEGELISTKPIKGTIRRGKNAEEDEELKNSLHHNIKERTENVMAVDVARNDLSQFAKKGTVKVNKLYNIETFETVHQMVSTVSCEIKDKTSFEKILDSAFPMASMTGAPKLRAMQLIGEFEDFERKYYSGAMGLIDGNGDFTLSVIIRSIFYNQATKKLSIAAGGAITYLSDPEKEYEECLLKAEALLKVLGAIVL